LNYKVVSEAVSSFRQGKKFRCMLEIWNWKRFLQKRRESIAVKEKINTEKAKT
jgi:hypothetical protein